MIRKRKTLLLAILILAICSQSFGQSTDQNFILSHVYKQKGGAINLNNVKTNIQYLDGLGRPLQTITMGQAPSGNDAVIPITYDSFGRQNISYLPYTAATSSTFQSTAVVNQTSFYQGNTLGLQGNDNVKAYSETLFETAPLNRPTGSIATGNNSLVSNIVYAANIANEVKRYDAPYSENGYYDANQLSKTTFTDENGKISETFTDKEGQIVCKKIKNGGESLDTYNVFDINNRLATVLQPEYQNTSNVDYFGFQYQYDEFSRLIASKTPGAGWQYMVYDTFNRIRFQQDANQRNRGIWYFIKYDASNRIVYSGEISSGQSATDLKVALINNNGHHETRLNSGLGYSLANTYPVVTDNDIYNEIFYDNYTGINFSYANTYGTAANTAVIGQITGTRTKIIGNNTKLVAVNFYDAEYRPIQTVRDMFNLSGRMERSSIKYKYDLSPVIAEQKTEQFASNLPTNSHTKTIEYDHADRPLSIQETVSLGNVTKTAYTQAYRYNELGVPTQKWTHSTDGINYRSRTDQYYNIRGWLTEGNTVMKPSGQETRHFGYLLNYNNGTKYTNGNITQMFIANEFENGYSKGIGFGYDGANRLLTNTGVGGYADLEPNIAYDKNGNIGSLSRTGASAGNYSYTYNGNQISTVNGNGYAFDANGNTTYDGTRNLSLSYNYLNLTAAITGSGLNQAYSYDCNGQKLEFASGASTTKYAGVFEYDGNNAVARVNITDGQAIIQNGAIVFQYYHKDHLGNVRSMVDENGITLQRTDYYGFGKEIARSGAGNKYLYNGKEKQDGTGYLDFGARFLDSNVPHFMTIDPKFIKREWLTPYNFVQNNPYNRIDPEGSFDDFLVDRNGVLKDVVKTKSPDRILQVDDKNITENVYDLNDSNTDSKQLRNNNIGDQIVTFISDLEINGMMKNSGIKLKNPISRTFYAATQAEGLMDFGKQYFDKKSDIYHSNYNKVGDDEPLGLFILGGTNTVYNALDAGNFLWGNAMKNLGFGITTAILGSNYNNWMSYDSMDSKADQNAIKAGFIYMPQTNISVKIPKHKYAKND